MKIINSLINSNIFISLAALILAVETQIQLGMKPQWHPYLFIIFFATLFEYNLHRLNTLQTNIRALKAEKYEWVRNNLKLFYSLVFISVIGFIISALLAKHAVLIVLAPIAAVTVFYSLPVFSKQRNIFRLREIPFLKIFLIAIVWASATILLPVIQSDRVFDHYHVLAMLAERFFFILAITIPFDVRDIEADKLSGLKTIPTVLNERRSLWISYLALLCFILISFFHYQTAGMHFILFSFVISAFTTSYFLRSEKMKKSDIYHYGILDGTMILQGLIVIAFYYLNFCFIL